MLSSGANTDVHEVARAATLPLWFQLYVQRDRGLTPDIVRHAEAAGVKALCVTVDNPVEACRHREQRAALELPEENGHPNYLGRRREPRFLISLDDVHPQALDWQLVEWLVSVSRVPVVLKGILTPADAECAIGAGAAAVIVSNHGGRALDSVPATIEALPAVAERVSGRLPVLVNGGIRRGTDVLKALACGARAVLIGRPALYGLAIGGVEGVTHVLKTLRMEFLAAMALTGCADVDAIDRTVRWA